MNRNRLELRLFTLAYLLAWTMLACPGQAHAAAEIAVAVLDFEANQAKGLDNNAGAMIAALLSARLSGVDGIGLVDRTALDRTMEEQALSLSGMVDAQTATRVGRLVGAHVLVTGRAFTISSKLIVTARLIATETGNFYAVAEEGAAGAEIADLVSKLAQKMNRVLTERRKEFVGGAPLRKAPDLVAEVMQALSGMTLPRVAVRVQETLLDVEMRDSVAADELTSLLLALNLQVIQAADPHPPTTLQEYLSNSSASVDSLGVDVIIFGKAAGEFGLRTGDLVSAKGEVKFTAVETVTKRVLAVSEARQKGIDVVVDGAATQAVAAATRESARDFVPKVVRAWNQKP